MTGKKTAVTITDISRKLGLSTATVSRVLNDLDYPVRPEVKKRVLACAKEMNYVPNMFGKLLKSGSSKNIGVLLPSLANPFYAHVIEGVERTCREYGMLPLFCVSGNSPAMESTYIKHFMENRVAGMLLFTTNTATHEIQKALDRNIAVILIDQKMDQLVCDSVCYDFFAAGKMAVQHLVAQGHREIAFITLPLERHSRIALKNGVFEEMELQGIEHPETKLMELQSTSCTPGDLEISQEQMASFFQLWEKHQTATAVIACNDMLAIKFMKFLQSIHVQVPQQVSVMGFDNIEMCAYTTPTLTTITQPSYITGELAVKTIVAQIERKKSDGLDLSNILMLKPELVERESVRSILGEAQSGK